MILQPSKSNTTLKTKITQNTQKWEQLINATGGKLEIPKCTVSILEWDTDKENIPIINNHSSITNIPIVNSSTHQVDLSPSIPAAQAYKLLGDQIALNGNQKEQYKKCVKNATNMLLCMPNTNFVPMIYKQVIIKCFYPQLNMH